MPVVEQVCPHCGASTRKSKGKGPRGINFVAAQHHTATTTYLQRRYKCQECNPTSFNSWFPQIVNALVLPYSNGFIEGCNNNIKVLKRIRYGLRHLERFKVLILLLSKKNSTSYLNS